MKKTLLSAAAIIIAGVSAHAQTTGTPPSFGTFNPYGNVDTTQSTYTTTTLGNDSLTLALNVTPHFSATPVIPPVNSLGLGKYGVSTGTGVDSRSFWNFDFAVTAPLGSTYKYLVTIVNENNGLSTSFNPANPPITDDNVSPDGKTFGNGESLDFTLSAPAFFGSIGYNPNANDTYDITLTATPANGGQGASDSIQVIAGTGTVPDATSTMGLMSASIAALGLISRRFRK